MAFYHCLLMDLDGTLLDFDAAEATAIRDALTHFDLPATDEVVAQYHAINTALWSALERGELRQEKLVVQRFEQLLAQLGKTGDAVRMNDYYLTQLSLGADVMEGVKETLQRLAEVATIAIVSNGVESVQAGRLERSGLGDMVDGMFISSRVGATKPARKIFDVALQTLGIENQKKVLVVGDSLKADIAGGAGAGLATCWCNFKDAPLPEGGVQPDYIIHSFLELPGIVMEQEELENVESNERHRPV
ncbi:MAG: YjjG family noncanonical pyrimidine nucleotidase [Ruthenibacterium sp.]